MATIIQQRSKVNSRSAGPIATATALASFGDRCGFTIQNQATAALFVKFGDSCSTSDYDIVLKGGAGAADGSGGALYERGTMVYTGIITVAASGTPSYTASDY